MYTKKSLESNSNKRRVKNAAVLNSAAKTLKNATEIERKAIQLVKQAAIPVSMNEVFNKETTPFPKIRSLLITREILKYLGLRETLDFLKKGNRKTRTYLRNNFQMLRTVVKYSTFLQNLQVDPIHIFAYCGSPDTVLQMHQVICK